MKPHVLLGISGSIAAYKSPDIVRFLKKNNLDVTCVLTRSASKFVTTFTLENVSENKCYTDDDFWKEPNLHVLLTKTASLFVIAPASVHTIAKYVNSITDNLLMNCLSSYKGSVVFVPSMHTQMYENDFQQKNISILKESRNFHYINMFLK